MILQLFATALIADATSAPISPQRIYHGLSRAFVAQAPESKGWPVGPDSDRRGPRYSVSRPPILVEDRNYDEREGCQSKEE